MFTKSILLLALSALSIATPVRRQGGGCKPPKPPAATLPLTGGDDELVSPPANVTLAKIGLGHGIQNYTCTLSTPTTDAPQATLSAAANGALAVLYDVTKLYPTSSDSELTIEEFQALTTDILWESDVPLNVDESAATDKSFPATSDPFPEPAPANLPGMAPIPFLGHHFFLGKVPAFDLLPTAGLFASVKKDDAVAAPASADPGPSGSGAVSWLQLGDDGTSQGVAYVYRVTTAGGNPLPCNAAGDTFSIPYAAMYWFYVPA